MTHAEVLIYQTRSGFWRARVRNSHGTAYTCAYHARRGVLTEIGQILDGVSPAEGQPCLNPEIVEASPWPQEIEG